MIERPAAAAKELVENALDAGARRIAVAVSGGGIERIEVVDDGIGMDAAALPLAIRRHCTSKLPDPPEPSRGDVLDGIRTLGFRGEALPSIGAAARLCITSRPPPEGEAWRIRVAAGRVEPLEPCSAPLGAARRPRGG